MTTLGTSDIPASDVARRLRRPLRVGALLFVVSLGFAGWGFAEWRQERVLDDGPRVQAEVVDTDYRRRLPDLVIVRYEVGDQRYEEALPADISSLDPGDRIEIIYDPAAPSHARPVEGWSPTFQFLWIVAPAVAIGGIGLASYDRRRARAAIRAVESGSKARMWVRHYRRWSWARRGHQHLAALWHSENEPPADERPDLVVEVASRGAKHLENGPAVVHGDLRPGGWPLLRVAGHTIWPYAKSRSELPKGAEPA